MVKHFRKLDDKEPGNFTLRFFLYYEKRFDTITCAVFTTRVSKRNPYGVTVP